MSQWYYADRQRQQQGPVDTRTLAGLFHAAQVDSATLVWRDGLANWQPLSSIRGELGQEVRLELEPLGPPQAGTSAAPAGSAAVRVPARAETGTAAAEAAPGDPDPGGRATLDFRMPVAAYAPRPPAGAAAGPVAAPAVATGAGNPAAAAPTPGEEDEPAEEAEVHWVVLAGFWKRVAAYLIDSVLITGAALAALVGLAWLGLRPVAPPGMGDLLPRTTWMAAAAVYSVLFHASGLQATPGKLAVGIKVVDAEGERLGLAHAGLRHLASLLNFAVCGLLYLMAAFTARNQCLHDILCNTLVVDRWAYTGHPERQRDELGLVTVMVLFLAGMSILTVIVGSIMLAGTLWSAMSGWGR
jgi:uncharacterized RDD family membrane protein YckC